MIKIYLGIASRKDGSWGMFQSILRNAMTLNREKMQLTIEPNVGDSLICRSRQDMTYKFLQTDCTHFMQLDDDIELQSNAILKLVKADKPIVGGVYRLKTMEKEVKELDEMTKTGYQLALRAITPFSISGDSEDLVKIRYLSTGCFLQKREVVEKMWDNYSELTYYHNTTTKERRALYMPMVYKEEYLSEDWAYCQRAMDIGYDVWLHTGVYCGHWGIYNYGFNGAE